MIENKRLFCKVLDGERGLSLVLNFFNSIYPPLKKADPQFNWNSQKILESYKAENTIFFAGFENEHVVALMCVQKVSPTQFDLHLILTSPAFRRMGVAEFLFAEFGGKMCEPGDEIWLEVHDQNAAAIQLYEKLGFQTDGFRNQYYPDGARARNMSRKL